MVNRLLLVLAALLIALGALWALQGAGVVHLKPVLCVADCAELQGESTQWLATGLGTIVAGAAIGYFARRRARDARTSS